jgi:hypothetical protein
MKFILSLSLATLLLFQFGCSNQVSGSYKYEPIKKVLFEIELKNIKAHTETKSVFLFFTCKIDNGSNNPLFFNYAKIKANVNNYENSFTYYDSLASAEPDTEELEMGVSVYKLYFVFPDAMGEKPIKDFKITNFGLATSK